MDKKEKEPIGYRIFSVIQTILVYGLAIGIVVSAILYVTSQNPDKSIFGYRNYNVVTQSMTPTYDAGDMVIVKCVGIDEIQVGDVVTFHPSSDSDVCLTHRVTEITTDFQGTGETCIKTKGDANDTEDSFWVDDTRIVGTVQFCIPRLGYLVRFVQLRWYYVIPLVIMLFLMVKLLRIYFAGEPEKSDPSVETA